MPDLNDVFPPALAPARNRNIKLPPSERMIVDDILANIEENKEYTWENAIDALKRVMLRYSNSENPVKGKGGNKYLPLELIQLIYYISYKCGASQEEILKRFKENHHI